VFEEILKKIVRLTLQSRTTEYYKNVDMNDDSNRRVRPA
jgi:hypothetical protein